MSAALAILGKIWPYLVAAAFGAWLTHKADSVSLARAQTTLASYKAQVADEMAAAEKAAREELQAQIDHRHAVDRNNEQVMDELRQRTQEAESHRNADRDAIRGLLNAASKAPPSGSGEVRESKNRPGPQEASSARGVEIVSETCAALAAEDERNADTLDGLNRQLDGQVQEP